jgi:hypothetical protein
MATGALITRSGRLLAPPLFQVADVANGEASAHALVGLAMVGLVQPIRRSGEAG